MDTNKIITGERARLERALKCVKGADNRETFRATLDRAAGRYALGRMDAGEFRAVAGELVRDADGTAAQQEREADAAPWATMPTDGSGSLGRIGRVVVALTLAACLVAAGWIGALVATGADAREAPAGSAQVPVTVTGLPAGPGMPDRDAARELIIEGAWLSWHTYTECGQGPAACDAVLRDVNANPYGVHFFEDGSAVDPARN